MFRLFVVVPLVMVLPRPTAEEAQPQLRHFVDRKFEAALRVSDVVKVRFLIASAATACPHVDNLFGYNLLLSEFTERHQALIVKAADEGRAQGARSALAGDADCASKLRGLRAADDELVVLSEQVAREDQRP